MPSSAKKRRRRDRRTTSASVAGILRPADITSSCSPPAPREVPVLRARLAAWLEDIGLEFYLAATVSGRQQVLPAMSSAESAASIARSETARVNGDLSWVSAPMAELARHAGPQLPDRSLYPHDVPSRAGLMIFEAPIITYRNSEGSEVEIVAASWGPWKGPYADRDDGLWLTFYSHPAPMLPASSFSGGTADGSRVPGWGSVRAAIPPILPGNEAGWEFGDVRANQCQAAPKLHGLEITAASPSRGGGLVPAGF